MMPEPIMRMICLIFAALLVLPSVALAEKILDIDPKKGGVEAKGPGKQKPRKIPVGGKTSPRQIKPDKRRFVPERIEFISAEPPRYVLKQLEFDRRYVVRLVFLLLPSTDEQDVELRYGRNIGDAVLLKAKRVKRTKIFETRAFSLTRESKRTVTRTVYKIPYRPLTGSIVAEGPGKKKKRIRVISGPAPRDFQRKIVRKTHEATSRISRKYERRKKKFKKSFPLRWTRFLATQKSMKARMKIAGGRCDFLRYAIAKSERKRAYDMLYENLRADGKRLGAMLANSLVRMERIEDYINRLRERWKDLTFRAKLTSSGAKLVNAAVKPTIDRYDASKKIELLRLKLKLLKKQINDYRHIKYRAPAYPRRCPPPRRK